MTPPSLSLREARRLILGLASPAGPENMALDHALGRLAAAPLKALLPLPSFSHSTRDGYAVRSRDLARASTTRPVRLEVAGEIAAGRTDLPTLYPGRSLRIMTGAAIPPGCNLIIAQEDVELEGSVIIVRECPPPGSHIRRIGSGIGKGKTIVRAGTPLNAYDLALLATAGVTTVPVHQQPGVALLCTGSELVSPGVMPAPGQVISGNRLLLDGLVRQNGGEIRSCDTIPDREEMLVDRLKALLAGHPSLVLTTGGMGPGKFDLMREVFAEIGIETVYTSLRIRPGRSTMLGVHGNTLLFALPGPPPAVRLLFNELVRPALRKTCGWRPDSYRHFRAELSKSLDLRPGDYSSLKGGIYSFAEGKIRVAPAGRMATINCIMLLPAHRCSFKAGEQVTVSPVS